MLPGRIKRASHVSEQALLNVNDVVLVKGDILTARSSWRMARVDSLVVGRDGNVRGGVLSAVSRNGKRTKLTRPLQKRIPLEVTSRTKNTCSNGDINIINDTDVSIPGNSAFDCADKLKEDKRVTNPERSEIDYSNHEVQPSITHRARRTAAKVGELATRINNLK